MYKIILVDSDVIRHFIAAGRINDLAKILAPNQLFIVSNVYRELEKDSERKAIVDAWMKNSHIFKIDFPYANENVRKEYYRLKKYDGLKGDGEKACMAMARFCKEVIASSNFRDIKEYAQLNNIEYIGCIDILYIAWKNGYLSEQDCNMFISLACKINNARFPVADIGSYAPDRDLSYYIHK